MKLKTLKTVPLFAIIPLLMASCGNQEPTKDLNSLPNTLEVKHLSKTYVITGIGLRRTKKVAIINDEVVTLGMELDPGVVLKDIQPTYAVILHGNTEHLLRPENIQEELDKKKH